MGHLPLGSIVLDVARQCVDNAVRMVQQGVAHSASTFSFRTSSPPPINPFRIFAFLHFFVLPFKYASPLTWKTACGSLLYSRHRKRGCWEEEVNNHTYKARESRRIATSQSSRPIQAMVKVSGASALLSIVLTLALGIHAAPIERVQGDCVASASTTGVSLFPDRFLVAGDSKTVGDHVTTVSPSMRSFELLTRRRTLGLATLCLLLYVFPRC
jgi:hypothetical protein